MDKLLEDMENDHWWIKLWRWVHLQRWMLYCRISNRSQYIASPEEEKSSCQGCVFLDENYNCTKSVNFVNSLDIASDCLKRGIIYKKRCFHN